MTISGYLAFFIVVVVSSIPYLWIRKVLAYRSFGWDLESAAQAHEAGQINREEFLQILDRLEEINQDLSKLPYLNLIFSSYVLNILVGYLLSDADARTIPNSMSALTSLASVPWMHVDRLLSSILF